MKVSVVHADAVTGKLTPAEELACAQLGGRRRDEWALGRRAARALVGDASVLVAPDGAPIVDGQHVSISHDGGWIAVAVDARPVGIDLCRRAHAPRIARILAWLGVASDAEPVVAWAALEAVLKLRRRSIIELRDCALAVSSEADSVLVRGLGESVRVTVCGAPAYVVATCGS